MPRVLRSCHGCGPQSVGFCRKEAERVHTGNRCRRSLRGHLRAKPAKNSGVLKKRCLRRNSPARLPAQIPRALLLTDRPGALRSPPLPSAPRLFRTALLSLPRTRSRPSPRTSPIDPVPRAPSRHPLANWRNVDSPCFFAPSPSRFWHRWRQPREARTTRANLKKRWRPCPSLMPSENIRHFPPSTDCFSKAPCSSTPPGAPGVVRLGQKLRQGISLLNSTEILRFREIAQSIARNRPRIEGETRAALHVCYRCGPPAVARHAA